MKTVQPGRQKAAPCGPGQIELPRAHQHVHQAMCRPSTTTMQQICGSDRKVRHFVNIIGPGCPLLLLERCYLISAAAVITNPAQQHIAFVRWSCTP